MIRRYAMTVLILITLSALAAWAAKDEEFLPYPNDSLIIPGVRVGWCYLGMPFGKVESTWGKPRDATKPAYPGHRPTEKELVYDSYGLTFFVSMKEEKVLSILVKSPLFRIPYGIALGTSYAEIEKIYGAPTMDNQEWEVERTVGPTPSVKYKRRISRFLVYKGLGLNVGLSEQDTVISMLVKRG